MPIASLCKHLLKVEVVAHRLVQAICKASPRWCRSFMVSMWWTMRGP